MRKLGVSTGSIDDAVQAVFLVADQRGGYRPGPAAPRTWLGAIAIRVAANIRRQDKRIVIRDNRYGRTNHVQHPPAQDAALASKRALERVHATMDSMPGIYRSVLLATLAGYSGDEIAAALEIPVGTAYRRLHVARKMLTDSLTPEIDYESIVEK